MRSNLIFCKSKVFIHQSTNAQDNLPGFVLMTLQSNLPHQEAQLQWIPESALNTKQIKWLMDADRSLGKPSASLSSATIGSIGQAMDNAILIDTIGTYLSFSMKVSSIYSIEFRPPSPSGWWFGSMIIHPRNIDLQTLPVLFFHDNICESTKLKRNELNKDFDPFTSGGDIYWGGVDLRNMMKLLIDLQMTLVDPNVWLVNASLDDLRNFSTKKLTDKKAAASSASILKPDGETMKNFWDKFESTKWSIMSTIASTTTKAESLMNDLIKRHPVVKFVENNNDNPYVQSLLKNPRVQEIQNDFDSARIYLAKWSLGVTEEASKYKLSHKMDDSYRKMITNELGFSVDTDTNFTDIELNRAMERNFILTKLKWESFFDTQGRLAVTVNEVKDYIFHGGIDDMELRKIVWLYLLDVYPWDSSEDERIQLDQTLKESYDQYKSQWQNIVYEEEEEQEKEYWEDQVFRIEKDVKRNDRNIDIYKYNTLDGKNSEPTVENNTTEESENNDDNSQWTIHNPHLKSLVNILKTYNVYNPNLGYVQGMTDLLSPIYYILRDETKAFWCFAHFMDRMERNFLRDQSGIRDQMLTLTELTQLMLPKLSDHLEKCDSSNLFFCFRMLLVWFKREFKFDDVCSIWEIFFTDYYSSQFQLFFMLAILQKNSEPIIKNLNQFDQVIKYFNNLHNTMNFKDLIIRSELLFIRFEKLITLMERKSEFIDKVPDSKLPSESKYLQRLLSKKPLIQKESKRDKDSIR